MEDKGNESERDTVETAQIRISVFNGAHGRWTQLRVVAWNVYKEKKEQDTSIHQMNALISLNIKCNRLVYYPIHVLLVSALLSFQAEDLFCCRSPPHLVCRYTCIWELTPSHVRILSGGESVLPDWTDPLYKWQVH